MAQFDFYEYAGPNRSVAYLLDVQSNLLQGLATRLVIPLVKLEHFGPPMKKLNPVFTIEGEEHVLATSEIAGIPIKALGRRAGTLHARSPEIKGSIDFLQDGY